MRKLKSRNKFRLFKIPRYLPGSVPKSVLRGDLKRFNEHRYKVFTAEPKVDDDPPKLNPLVYINTQRLTRDAARLTEINKENATMLKHINVINRTGGYIDSFNPIAYERRSNWRRKELETKSIEYHNKSIYNTINKAKSDYNTKDMNERWKLMVEKIKQGCRFPICIFGQMTLDQQLSKSPSISDGLGQRDCRPKCYLDIRVKNGVYLGRLIIELYQDYVPVTVQNFLSICRGECNLSYKNCPIHRIYTGKYMETGDITKGNGKGGRSVYGKSFPEENFSLSHTKTGVLAMRRLSKKTNNSQFRIMFSAIPDLDKHQVVFGRVIKGNSVLMQISELGRQSGVPSAPVSIMQCGDFIPGKTPLAKKHVYGFRPAH